MFERFTDRARRVVLLAQEEARLLSHNYIGTEHLLLGLIREHDGVAAQALVRVGVSAEVIRVRVEEIIGQGGSAPGGHIPFTPRAKKVMELSLREALQLGHNYIGTEHLLLGLIREGDGVAAQVLGQLGVDLSDVRREVIQVLSGNAPPPPPLPVRPAPSDTPAASRAADEARRRAGRRPVGTHDVLSAIVGDENSLGAKALAALGVTAEALEAQLARLNPAGTSDELPSEAGARRLSIEIVGDRIGVFLDDEATVDRLRTALEGEVAVLRSDHPAAVSFPGLWQDLTGHLADVSARLEAEAAERWRPPEWNSDWDVAVFAVIDGPVGIRSFLEVDPDIDRDQVRADLADWLRTNEPSDEGRFTYLAIMVRSTKGGRRSFSLSTGVRPGWPMTRVQILAARAIVDLEARPQRTTNRSARP